MGIRHNLVLKNRIQSVVEYVLSALWLLAAVSTLFLPPFGEGGFLVLLFGGQIALYVYSVWFAFLGLWLIYAKIRKRKKAHRYALFAMWLTTAYTVSLSIALEGFVLAGLIDDFVIGAAAAICWLRWKMLTEYIDDSEFEEFVIEQRDWNFPETP